MEIDFMSLEGALQVLGQLLADRGFYYEVVAVGGGGLLLLGLIKRTTKDLDLVSLVKEKKLISANPLPQPLAQAAKEVGAVLDLGKEWFNTGPTSLMDLGLPRGFAGRLHRRDYKGLIVYLADRFDQICFKLYASVDQGPHSKHFIDLCTLKPSLQELHQAKNWCLTQDTSNDFENDIIKAIQAVYVS